MNMRISPGIFLNDGWRFITCRIFCSNERLLRNEQCESFLIAGDLEEDLSADHQFCVENIKDFTSAFLFSLETQHTIG